MKRLFYSSMVLTGVLLAAGDLYGKDAVYHWCFDEGQGNVSVESKGKLKATLADPTKKTTWTGGKKGNALHVKGIKGVKGVGAAVLPLKGDLFMKEFTLEIWTRFDDGIRPGAFRDIIANGGEKGPGFRLTYWLRGLRVISGDGKKIASAASEKLNILPGVWNMIVMTYNGKKVEIFLNGQKVCSSDFVLTKGHNKVSLGSFGYGYAYSMEGALDEFRYYDYVRTNKEIIESYQKNLL